jgi:diguanylate cyclase (GGDEF)-like protein
MTIDEVVQLVKANQMNLTSLQELVLRQAWEEKTYTTIAIEAHYGEERIRKVASKLWQSLSKLWGEPIAKTNFRVTLESRHLTKAEVQLIKEFCRQETIVPLEFPDSPVASNSNLYINRPPVEQIAFAEITEPGSVLCIKGARKMGKSSLILRILAHGAEQGFRTVSLDFQQADTAVFANLDKFLRWFCANIARELNILPKLDDYWDEDLGSKVSCTIYFQRYLLESLKNPLLLALNEVNRVFEYPEVAQDFLSLLRYWYEQAKQLEVWQKLRLVVAYSTEIYIPLNLHQSPFNIGLPLKLPPFTALQVQDLAQRHGLSWTANDTEQLMAMVGGHPYLIRLALYHLVSNSHISGLEQLLQQAPTESGIYSDHLRQYLIALQEEPKLAAALKQVIATPMKLEPILQERLQSMGLINIDSDRASISLELYRLYFQQQLLPSIDLSSSRIHQLERENQELRYLSSLDELTQIPHRRYFNTYLQIEWKHATERQTPLGLILCDIDYFKIYNKTYGTPAGDDCLRQIATAIRMCLQRRFDHPKAGSNLVARYGGEEFAVILPQADATTAVYIAENIRSDVKALAIPCKYPGIGGLPATVLTVSLGVASIVPPTDGDPTTLVQAVEQAVYQSKRKGRDRVTLS